MSGSLPNNTKRKQLYRCFVVGEYGTLGRHNRVRIPECVVTFIRSLCPDSEGVYMGHRDVGDGTGANTVEDVCQDIGNESFESILPDGSSINGVTNINFDAGEKVKVCVTFECFRIPCSWMAGIICGEFFHNCHYYMQQR